MFWRAGETYGKPDGAWGLCVISMGMVRVATKSNKYGLKPKQLKMVQTLADPGFTGTVTELCAQIGVARSTFYDWMGQEQFKACLTDFIGKYADSELAAVWKALIRKCTDGDVQAIKLYFDVRERGAGGHEGVDSGWFK